jgi:hypothetical protein
LSSVPYVLPYYSTRSGLTAFWVEFSSQRDHRQKSFMRDLLHWFLFCLFFCFPASAIAVCAADPHRPILFTGQVFFFLEPQLPRGDSLNVMLVFMSSSSLCPNLSIMVQGMMLTHAPHPPSIWFVGMPSKCRLIYSGFICLPNSADFSKIALSAPSASRATSGPGKLN